MWSLRKRSSVFGFSLSILLKDNRFYDYSKSKTFELSVQFLWWRLEFTYTYQKPLGSSDRPNDIKSEEK